MILINMTSKVYRKITSLVIKILAHLYTIQNQSFKITFYWIKF